MGNSKKLHIFSFIFYSYSRELQAATCYGTDTVRGGPHFRGRNQGRIAISQIGSRELSCSPSAAPAPSSPLGYPGLPPSSRGRRPARRRGVGPAPCVTRSDAEACRGACRGCQATAPLPRPLPPVVSPPSPGQSRAEARGAAVSGSESQGKRRDAEGSSPGASGRCLPDPPQPPPLPHGGPELADGRHRSRARAEGCGAARSRTPAPAAEIGG